MTTAASQNKKKSEMNNKLRPHFRVPIATASKLFSWHTARFPLATKRSDAGMMRDLLLTQIQHDTALTKFAAYLNANPALLTADAVKVLKTAQTRKLYCRFMLDKDALLLQNVFMTARDLLPTTAKGLSKGQIIWLLVSAYAVMPTESKG